MVVDRNNFPLQAYPYYRLEKLHAEEDSDGGGGNGGSGGVVVSVPDDSAVGLVFIPGMTPNHN